MEFSDMVMPKACFALRTIAIYNTASGLQTQWR